MPNLTSRRRSVRALAACVASAAAMAASAGPLIQFTDADPLGASSGALSDTGANRAVSWTQTRATHDVSISALLSTNVSVRTTSWYVTTAIGAGATAADVVYSGSVTMTTEDIPSDYNGVPRALLGDGFDFDAGTYYLVFDGPPGSSINNAEWTGGSATVALDPAFTIGGYYVATGGSVAAFAPQSGFAAAPNRNLVFELTEATPAATVPVPATLPLTLLAGVACAVATRRGRRAWAARA